MESVVQKTVRQMSFLTWDEYTLLVEELAEKIKNSGRGYKALVGIPRGGLVLAVMISHILDIPLAYDSRVAGQNKEILVVDDIADSGSTCYEVAGKCGIDTAAVYKYVGCKVEPTYFARSTVDWIVFPYERNGASDTVSKALF